MVARLEVDEDVGVGEGVADRGLDRVGGAVALDDRLAGRDGDHRVGEVVAAGLPQAQAAQLDAGAEAVDGLLGAGLGVGGGGVHQHARVLVEQPAGGGEDDAGDDQGGDGIARGDPRDDGGQAGEDGDRAGHVAREVERVGAQRGGLVEASGADRDDDPGDVDDQRDGDDDEDVPARFDRVVAADELVGRLGDDEQAAADEDRGLAERAEVLRAPVPVVVVRVRRAAAEADRQERQDGGDDVAGGLDPGRDQAQAAGDDAGAEFEHHQHGGGRDRDQRGPRLTLCVRRHRPHSRGVRPAGRRRPPRDGGGA